jgi:predicted amidophosphoribosyltransferase
MAARHGPPAWPPLGFPQCPQCSYLRTGPPHTCLDCAGRTFEHIAEGACPVCSQMLDGGDCPNWLCTDPERRISKIDAIAYLSGALRDKVHRYKYEGMWGWSIIFGRLLLSWLERNARTNRPDIILANPTYTGEGGAPFGHTERVLEKAANEDLLGTWPFDVGTPSRLIKTAATDKSAGNHAPVKREAGRRLRGFLRLEDPDCVRGRRVLVYDDVCTTGSQLDAIAGYLVDVGGAAEVRGIVLARAPWRP